MNATNIKPSWIFPEWSICNIEALDETTAKALAMIKTEVKDHKVYFIDFGDPFGFACCVFCNGRHIYYANDYELHHKGRTHQELFDWYMDSLNNTLYTESELREPSKDYDEARRKEYFLRNYYPMRTERLSIFGNYSAKDAEDAFLEAKKAFPYYSDLAFAYFKDKAFVDHMNDLYDAIQEADEKRRNDFEYLRGAFLSEMQNHEYHINTYQGDFDTLSAFGNLEWRGESDHELQDYFDQLHFNDTQKSAYYQARRDCLRIAAENDWY